mmetsp:Transcript_1853/g.4436  ORF Transcript_1853/g.4436 Transcript_1853/m.4436 type:complete len:162 (-) Transcript_1853:852-1337(-)
MKFSLCALFMVASTANAFSSRTAGSRSASALHSSTVDTPSMARSQTKVPVFDEVCDTTGVTLTRFMNEVAMLNPELRELTTLFGAIDTACKAMTNLVKRSQLPSSETLGYQGEVNIQGEDQKKTRCNHKRSFEASASFHRTPRCLGFRRGRRSRRLGRRSY